jgi:hypothetical protein
LAAASVPILPEAPVRFSTRKERPVFCVMRCATRRATTSTAEAAANGLIITTGLDGQSCCASATVEKSAAASAVM